MASKIQEFSDAVSAHNAAIDTAIDGLSGDIGGLKLEIERLQNTPGQITPEDQALLDSIQTRTENIANKLKALDEATAEPPTAPEEPIPDENVPSGGVNVPGDEESSGDAQRGARRK